MNKNIYNLYDNNLKVKSYSLIHYQTTTSANSEELFNFFDFNVN